MRSAFLVVVHESVQFSGTPKKSETLYIMSFKLLLFLSFYFVLFDVLHCCLLCRRVAGCAAFDFAKIHFIFHSL